MHKKWIAMALCLAFSGVCYAQQTFNPTTDGSNAGVSQTGNGTSTSAGGPIEGYANQPVNSGDTVSVSLTLNGSVTITPVFQGGGSLQIQYSINKGATWSTGIGFGSPGDGITYTNQPAGFTLPASAVSALGNLQNLEFRLFVTASASGCNSGCGGHAESYTLVSGDVTGGIVTYTD